MNQAFKVGDRVLISKTSDFYTIYDSISNPRDLEGTIIDCVEEKYNDDLNIEVRWDNGCTNSYNTKDLELVNKSYSIGISASKIEVKEEIKEEKPKKRRLLIG